ncbi:MAG: polysaccharide pyruvyl transferase family protein [Nanoarchaeota archaeon]
MVKIIHFHVKEKSNIGDVAIVLSLRDILKTKFKITSYTSKNIFDLKKRDYPWFIDILMKYFEILKFTSSIKLLDKNYRKIKNKLDDILLNKINKHDLMILGGGGLYSKWFFPLNDELINKIKIPIIIFGVGYNHNFGDKNLSSKELKSIIFLNRKAKLSSVRDLETKEFLKKLGFNADYIGDPAIFLKSKKINLKFEKNIKIALNIAQHGWKFQDKYTPQLVDYYTELIKNLGRTYNAKFFYIRHHSNENRVIKILKKRFPDMTICKYGPYETKYIYENMDLVISMMLHSSIFAFGSSVPVFNIAYDKKNHAFMRAINQENSFIDVRNLNLENISSDLKILSSLIKKKNNFLKIKKGFNKKTNEFVEKIRQITKK